MGKIILPHMSLSVYLRWPFGCNMALKVILPPKMLCFMRHRLLSPLYPATKSTKAKRTGKTLISVVGFFAFFCLDSGGDILKCLLPRTIVIFKNQTSWGKHGRHKIRF